IYFRVRVVPAQLRADAVALGVAVRHTAGLAPRQLIERRDGGVDIAVVYQRAHIAEEEGEQQRPYMAAVHVGVRHYDYLVVAELCNIEILAEAGAEGGYNGVELVIAVHLLLAHLFDIQHLSPERQDGLEAAVPPA